MGKLVFAFCDTDDVYVRRFATFFRRKKVHFAEIMTFTDRSAFEENHAKNTCLVWVLGEGFRDYKEQAPETVRVLFLTEEAGGNASDRSVYKYQQAQEVLQQILDKGRLLQAEEEQKKAAGLLPEKMVISLVSSGNHPGLTAFALALCKALGSQQGVIYLNLSECSGLTGFLGGSENNDISDLLYLCHEKDQKLQLDSFVNREADFDYIAGAGNPAIFFEAGKEAYQDLLQLLKEDQGHQLVVLEVGAMHGGFFPLLQASNQIVNLRQSGIMDDYQAEEFYGLCQRIQSQGGPEFMEKMREVRFDLPANVTDGWQLVSGLMELAAEVMDGGLWNN